LSIIGRVNISARWLGKLSTVVQLALVVVTLVAPDLAALRPAFAHGLTRTLWILVSLISIVSCLDYVLVGVRLLGSRHDLVIESGR
jgi:hypothetical protein